VFVPAPKLFQVLEMNDGPQRRVLLPEREQAADDDDGNHRVADPRHPLAGLKPLGQEATDTLRYERRSIGLPRATM
jgi:hypothetical protein